MKKVLVLVVVVVMGLFFVVFVVEIVIIFVLIATIIKVVSVKIIYYKKQYKVVFVQKVQVVKKYYKNVKVEQKVFE